MRLFLCLILTVSLLLPKATATLAVLMPGSFTTLVICTGSEFVQITLGPDGQPAGEAEVHGLQCLAEMATPFLKLHALSARPILSTRAPWRIERATSPASMPFEALPSRGGAPPVRQLSNPYVSLA